MGVWKKGVKKVFENLAGVNGVGGNRLIKVLGEERNKGHAKITRYTNINKSTLTHISTTRGQRVFWPPAINADGSPVV